MTLAALDYETKASYSVTVTATDPDSAATSIDVTITVTNEDEMGRVTFWRAGGRNNRRDNGAAGWRHNNGGVGPGSTG